MGEAHQRKKEPEQVRNALLDCAAKMTAEHGLANVTLEAVARAAGVTKGALFHHFPNKKVLIEAMFEKMVSQLDQLIDGYMADDEMEYGRFSRAYVEVAISDVSLDPLDPWASLCMSSMSEPELQKKWAEWMVHRLKVHKSTDNDPMLEIVRLAADGAWLAFMMQAHNSELTLDVPGLRARLIALTRKS
jgi:AcrR family transcriptional regulator